MMEKIRLKRLIKALLYTFILFLGTQFSFSLGDSLPISCFAVNIFGLALIAVGSKALIDMTAYSQWLDRYWLAPPVLDVLCGLASLFLAVLGFVAVSNENSTLLLMFSGLVGAITIIEVLAGVMAVSDSSMVRGSVKKALNDTIVKYSFSQENKIAWDELQRNLFCCGGTHSGQWTEVIGSKTSVPVSCCPGRRAASGPGSTTKTATTTPSPLPVCKRSTEWGEMYQQGCQEPLAIQFKTRLDELAVISIVFALLQIFGIALAVYFAIDVKREREIKEAVVKVLTEREATGISRGSNPKSIEVAVVETQVENVY